MDDTIKDDRGRDVDADEAVHLGEQLEVVGHLVADVEGAVLGGPVGDLEEGVDLGLVEADALGGELGEAPVRLVAGLVDDVDVEKVLLGVEEGGAVLPALGRVEAQDGQGRLVQQRGARVPGLDLLAEDDGEERGPRGVGAHEGEDVARERQELLGGEGAAVVDVELERVRRVRDRRGRGRRGRVRGGRGAELELVGGELGRDGHGCG